MTGGRSSSRRRSIAQSQPLYDMVMTERHADRVLLNVKDNENRQGQITFK
jgi:hypothetical protein